MSHAHSCQPVGRALALLRRCVAVTDEIPISLDFSDVHFLCALYFFYNNIIEATLSLYK